LIDTCSFMNMAAFKAVQERDFVENCVKLVGKCLEKTMAHDLVHV
jgi:hypothetical protein